MRFRINYFLSLLFLAALAFTGCKKKNNGEPEAPSNSQITKFRYLDMVEPHWQDVLWPSDNHIYMGLQDSITLQYDAQGRLSKKIGVWLPLAFSSGNEGYIFSKGGGLVFSHSGDEIKVSAKAFESGVVLLPISTTLTYSNSKLAKIAIQEGNDGPVHTIAFSYNAQGLLQQAVTTNGKSAGVYVQNFSFDAAGNLESINGQAKDKDGTQLYTTVENFGDYDKAPNPLKGFNFLSETFYRSLSVNNFRKYTKTVQYGRGSFIYRLDWKFNYDASGNWRLKS